jgi:hypothetical protein
VARLRRPAQPAPLRRLAPGTDVQTGWSRPTPDTAARATPGCRVAQRIEYRDRSRAGVEIPSVRWRPKTAVNSAGAFKATA